MEETVKKRKKNYIAWAFKRVCLGLYDALVINVSFILALIIRFYVGQEFHIVAGEYFTAFFHYTPFYTVFCLFVFSCFKMYNGMWRYAGINDLNRIAMANLVCFIGHVAGTMLFVHRMPVTFYCIGGMIQFVLVATCRFIYRLVLIEKGKLFYGRNKVSINAMVVGAGETGRIVLKQLERENVAHPVCVLRSSDDGFGGIMDGVPVVDGLDHLEETLEKYQVNLVIIADPRMPQDIRDRIRESCVHMEIESQDFSGYFQNSRSAVTLKSLMEYSTGPVDLVIDGGIAQSFTDGEQALSRVAGRYMVKSISARKSILVVELSSDAEISDLDDNWIRQHEQETGESISFF